MIGERIGTYSIVQKIGEGGMGTVWLAEHSVIGKRVAIKMLHAHVSGQTDLTTRFFNEARAAAAIQDPGIVQVFDFGQHRDGRAYIVMELLEGEALDRRINRLGRLSLPESLRIMQQVAGSLGAAHQRGIVHRDLKPDNIFLVRDAAVTGGERAKILDFGIAKISGGTGMKTETSVVMGTPLFMSPEQCRGAGQIDQRSDVYSLGCVLFILLTGRPPFAGEGPGEIIAMHLREVPPVPSTIVPGLPHTVDSLVLRCLEKDPARRYASAEDVAAALGAIHATTSGAMPAQSEPLPEVRRLSSTHATTLQPYSQVSRTANPSHASRWKHGSWLLAAGGGTILGVVAMVLAMRGGSAPAALEEDRSASISKTASQPLPAPSPASPGAGSSAQELIEMDEPLPQPSPASPAPPASPSPTPPASPATTSPKPLPAAPVAPTPGSPAPVKALEKPQPPRPPVAAPARPAPAKKELPDIDKLGTTPAPDCAAQSSKLEELIRSSYSMTPDAIVRTTKALTISCFNNKQLTRLLMVAIPAACTLNQESAVLRFYALAPSGPLRGKCEKYLAR